jgi:hypothetical protein
MYIFMYIFICNDIGGRMTYQVLAGQLADARHVVADVLEVALGLIHISV